MKETQPIVQDKVEIVKQVQAKKQTKLHRRIVPGDGHVCFEFDINTNELRKAEYITEANIDLNKRGHISRKINMKDGCIYVTSLNAKNAVKKLMKSLNIPFVKVISE